MGDHREHILGVRALDPRPRESRFRGAQLGHGIVYAMTLGRELLVCVLTTLVLQSAAGVYTRGKYFGITAGTLYWHFVDVIWVVLFSIFYLI